MNVGFINFFQQPNQVVKRILQRQTIETHFSKTFRMHLALTLASGLETTPRWQVGRQTPKAKMGLRVHDVKILSYAILTPCTAGASWFKPTGRLTVDEIAEIYENFILSGLKQGKS